MPIFYDISDVLRLRTYSFGIIRSKRPKDDFSWICFISDVIEPSGSAILKSMLRPIGIGKRIASFEKNKAISL